MAADGERLHQLFLLNLCLQLFDGVATYQGIWRWGEGNPFLQSLIPSFGLGMTLVVSKAKACGLLVVLRRLGDIPVVYPSLIVLAATYVAFSFVPWMTRFLSLLRA